MCQCDCSQKAEVICTVLLEQREPFTAPWQFYFPLTDAVSTLSEDCLQSKGSVRVFALHLCVTLHPARAPSAHHSPSPLSDHLTAIWTKPNSSPLWAHNTVKEGKIVFFHSVFSWKSMSCMVLGPFVKIELFCKYYAFRKDQNPLFFFTHFGELQYAACRILLLQIGVILAFSN